MQFGVIVFPGTWTAATHFTSELGEGGVISVPISHGEGNYYADDATLDEIESKWASFSERSGSPPPARRCHPRSSSRSKLWGATGRWSLLRKQPPICNSPEQDRTMTMKARLVDDLKQAMRARDTLRRDVIRYLRSEIRNQEIRVQKDLDDDAVVQALSRQAQQRRDSIEAFTQANRDDLVEKERAELAIIIEYMPQQLTRDEIAELVAQVVAEVGASGPGDMGKVMSRIMPQVRGRAEGREVSAIVMQTLRSA